MSRQGVIIIVQALENPYSRHAAVNNATLQDIVRYYAKPFVPWKLEYARSLVRRQSYPVELAEVQAKLIKDALTPLVFPSTVAQSHSPLLHMQHKDGVAWQQYWGTVCDLRDTRNHIVVALMQDAAKHVDILGAEICDDASYSSSFLPSNDRRGQAVVFTDYTLEHFKQGRANEPYRIEHLLQ